MSLENYIISEKYINKFINLSKSNHTNFIKTRSNLIIKYLLCDSINIFPISDNYLRNIRSDEQQPFIIKTDLYTELNELNSILNQSGLIKIVNDLNAEYQQELFDEITLRADLDQGQIFERNVQMLEDFKKEYGYDPQNNSVLTYNNKKDCFDNDLSEDEEEETEKADDEQVDEEKESESVIEENKNKDDITNKLTSNKVDQNGSLESLNQLIDIFDINLNEISKDIIQLDDNNIVIVSTTPDTKPKKRVSKKTSEEKQVTTKLTTNDLVTEINTMVKKIEELKKTNVSATAKQDGIQFLLTIADYYNNGIKLKKSTIKANMIYIYLIKKFNNPDAMYILGDALINGITIMKNHKQGAKLIKIAAEDYKHPKAITKMKLLKRISLKKEKVDQSDDEFDN